MAETQIHKQTTSNYSKLHSAFISSVLNWDAGHCFPPHVMHQQYIHGKAPRGSIVILAEHNWDGITTRRFNISAPYIEKSDF